MNNSASLLMRMRAFYSLYVPQSELAPIFCSRPLSYRRPFTRCFSNINRLLTTNTPRTTIHGIIPLTQRPFSPLKRRLLYGALFTLGGCTLVHHLNVHDSHLLHTFKAIQRVGQATWVGIQVAMDYQWWYMTCRHDENKKKQCHLKSAHRVLDGLQQLGGIYIKLGQHISAMQYILPVEWTSTLAILQDRCDPTSTRQELCNMFLTDYGLPLDQVFDRFDWDHPLGVASLAQVHRARLAATGEWVAVKLQHPRLDEFCKMDLDTVQAIVGFIKWAFPDFGFEWVLQEMKEALPLELDFVNEAYNARQVDANFGDDASTALVIPRIIWAQRRILCMEYIKGGRPDDLDYMQLHNIDPVKVSNEITIVFSKMIFMHGFVHCDPHPGNILIRPNTTTKHGHNFDLVLLDHGQYRTLDPGMRLDYAHLWLSLIRGDEAGIELYAHRLGCRPQSHRLFASLLTGREWHTIEAADLSSLKSTVEISRVSGRTSLFLGKIADILATLPRVMLLLLKTTDLLRHVDETLRPAHVSSRKNYTIMIYYCARAVWMDTRQKLWDRWRENRWWHWCGDYIRAWWTYQSLNWSLWFYQ
ncbi:ABC1 family-domain-containing protein [Chlamydoabsidia padenii]|nr:ABC1 family-domain-containing protein [Chlamydoabsidia padenii]